MRRNNKALYELIMRNVSREVKKALNESQLQYYIWYSNWEDGETHDMSYEEIESYQEGWCDGGPYNSLDEAKNALMDKVHEAMIDNFSDIDDDWYIEHDDSPTDDEIIEFMNDYLEIKNNGMNITFGGLHDDFNTYEWEIITADEKERREAEDDEDNNYYIVEFESEGYDEKDAGLFHSRHFGPYKSLEDANSNVKLIKLKTINSIIQDTIDDGEEPDIEDIKSWYLYKVVTEDELLNLIGFLYLHSLAKIQDAARSYLNDIDYLDDDDDNDDDDENTIACCPNCGYEFDVAEANYNDITGHLDYVCPKCGWYGDDSKVDYKEL